MQKLLPEHNKYPYRICSYESREKGFDAILRLPLKTRAEAEEWRKEYEKVSKETFRVRCTFPKSSLKNVFKVYTTFIIDVSGIISRSKINCIHFLSSRYS